MCILAGGATLTAVRSKGVGARHLRPTEKRSLTMATAAPAQPAAPHGGLKGLLARHPLVSFFVLAYALTWVAWSPWYLSEEGIGLLPYAAESISDYLNTVALIVGPTLSAFIMTGVIGGREG